MHQSVGGFRPCVQPEGTCIGMKFPRREPMKTRPQAAKVWCGIADASQRHLPISDKIVYTRLGTDMVHCNAQGRAAIRNRNGSEAASGSDSCSKGHAAHGRGKLGGTGFIIAAALGRNKPSGAKHIAGSPSRHAWTKGHEPSPQVPRSLFLSLMLGYARRSASLHSPLHACADSMSGNHRRPVEIKS